MFDKNKFILSANYSSNVPILISGTKKLTLSIKNLNTEDKAYNLSIKTILPDGMDIESAQLPYTSKSIDINNNTILQWINIKDLAQNEAKYTFFISLKCNTKFINGNNIPFNYSFPSIIVEAKIDTMPRGDFDSGNIKFNSSLILFFKAVRYEITLNIPKKVLKGAGFNINDRNYSNVYETTCTILNSTETSQINSIFIDLENGIRYTGNFLTVGMDKNKFISPNISTVTDEGGKIFTRLSFQNIVLSPYSNTTLIFYTAVWNKYNNNTGNLINHGTSMSTKASLSGDDGIITVEESFTALDIIINKSSSKLLTDVLDNVFFNLSYKIGQYYDINDIAIIEDIPDGIQFLNSSFNDYNISISSNIGITKLTFNIGNKPKNFSGIITVNCKIKESYLKTLLPIVSGDYFINNSIISGLNMELNLTIEDNSSSYMYINSPYVKKQILKLYYRDGSPKTSNIISPNDIAEFSLNYNALNISAIQKNIYVEDYFPLSITDINNIIYNYIGYIPDGITPELVDPHGVRFFLGNVPGNSTTTITYKTPITSLSYNAGDNNLLKMKGIDSYGFSYSSRDQISLYIGSPNIILTKSVSGPNINKIKSGEIYNYTITITNTNNLGTEVDAFNFQLIDILSDYFTLNENSISIIGNGLFKPAEITESNITIPIDKLSPGNSLTLKYSVTINNNISPNTSISTKASNTNGYSQLYDVSMNNYQFSRTDKSASTTIRSENISLVKTTTSTNLRVGSDIEYTITLEVPLGTTAYNVELKDTLPINEIYKGPAYKNDVIIEPNILNNIITFPIEDIIDASSSAVTKIYKFTANINNSNKTINSLTSTEINKASLTWSTAPIGETTRTLSYNYTVNINHPNIILSLLGKNKNSSENFNYTITSYSNKFIQIKLNFSNNSLVNIKNAILEIPLDVNYDFVSIDYENHCISNYNETNKKIILNIPALNSSSSGYILFTLKTISNLRAGTSIILSGLTTQYYNDLSPTKIYSGEKSNNFMLQLPANVSLLPYILNKIDDNTLFKTSIKGSINTIDNILTNTGNGIDDYRLTISKSVLEYTIYINNIKIADVPKNTVYSEIPELLKNIKPGDSKTITISYFVPINIPNDTKINFLVTVTSLTSPYPLKTLNNIDP